MCSALRQLGQVMFGGRGMSPFLVTCMKWGRRLVKTGLDPSTSAFVSALLFRCARPLPMWPQVAAGGRSTLEKLSATAIKAGDGLQRQVSAVGRG